MDRNRKKPRIKAQIQGLFYTSHLDKRYVFRTEAV